MQVYYLTTSQLEVYNFEGQYVATAMKLMIN